MLLTALASASDESDWLFRAEDLIQSMTNMVEPDWAASQLNGKQHGGQMQALSERRGSCLPMLGGG